MTRARGIRPHDGLPDRVHVVICADEHGVVGGADVTNGPATMEE